MGLYPAKLLIENFEVLNEIQILFGKRKRDVKALIIGLDASGKTSILYMLKLNELVTPIPTIGFNVEIVEYKNLKFTIWDIGGGDKIRPLFRHYYQLTNLVIWVVDSADQQRFQESRNELQKLCTDEELRNVPILIYANKQDLAGASTAAEIAEEFQLHQIRDRQWYIQDCQASNLQSLCSGLDWAVSLFNAQN